MRHLAFVLCLTACQTPEGPAGPAGPPGPQGEKGDPGPAGKDGKDGPPAKTLHLVVTATGEDLGVMIAAGGVAYRNDIKAVVSYGGEYPLLYADADCKGAARVSGGGYNLDNTAAVGPSTFLKRKGPKHTFRYRSILGASCMNTEGTDSAAREFDDTGVPAQPYADAELSAEMR